VNCLKNLLSYYRAESETVSMEHEKFGSQIPICEPAWYQGAKSPYYRKSHAEFRNRVRKFVDERIVPNIDDWIDLPKGYPKNLHVTAFQEGIQGIIYEAKYGGTRPADFDAFHELILWDEMGRIGGTGILGQMAINSMALPPILLAGSKQQKDRVAKDVIQGRKNISLCISEPGYGSDVANIETKAELKGDYYIVNGAKKWISGALMADFFTVAVRTGTKQDGLSGLSLLLMDKEMPGISIRKMRTSGDHSHHIGFITFEDVKVHKSNLIGQEGMGFYYVVFNFNHERFIIAAGTCRMARMCYEEALNWSLERKTFGKELHQHQAIRMKLAEMAFRIESLQDNLEKVAYQFSQGVPDKEMGEMCALLKVNASRTFEYCAREASQIFGGSSIVREGRGKVIERLSREVRSSAIPGGSEEILLDFAMRSTLSKAKKLRSML